MSFAEPERTALSPSLMQLGLEASGLIASGCASGPAIYVTVARLPLEQARRLADWIAARPGSRTGASFAVRRNPVGKSAAPRPKALSNQALPAARGCPSSCEIRRQVKHLQRSSDETDRRVPSLRSAMMRALYWPVRPPPGRLPAKDQ
jgi:hypothetical protein